MARWITLETQRGLRVHLFGARHLGRVVLDEVRQRCAQIIDIGRASAQHFSGTGVVQQGQQQVLHRDELVTLLTGLDKGHVQADFQFLGNHVISFCLPVIETVLLIGTNGPLFNGLCYTLQRVAALTCGVEHLIDLGLSDIARVDPTDAFAVQVDLEHDLGRRFPVFVEKLLDDDHHKLHRGVVVVEHDDLEHLRRLNTLGPSFEHNGIATVCCFCQIRRQRGGD